MNPARYTKALVALMGAAAAYAGIEIEQEVLTNAAIVLTPIAVYLLPNQL